MAVLQPSQPHLCPVKRAASFSCALPGDLVPLHQRQREGVPACSLGGGGVPAGRRAAEETGEITKLYHVSMGFDKMPETSGHLDSLEHPTRAHTSLCPPRRLVSLAGGFSPTQSLGLCLGKGCSLVGSSSTASFSSPWSSQHLSRGQTTAFQLRACTVPVSC